MIPERFLAATANEAWRSAAEIVAALDAANYWSAGQADVPHKLRQAYVRAQLQTLRQPDGTPAFMGIVMAGPHGRPQVLYKQVRLIRLRPWE